LATIAPHQLLDVWHDGSIEGCFSFLSKLSFYSLPKLGLVPLVPGDGGNPIITLEGADGGIPVVERAFL
jgi:hypothetical protein